MSGLIALPVDVPFVIGLGAELKATVSWLKAKDTVVSDVLGDLSTPDVVQAHRAVVERAFEEMDSPPALVAHDLHPDFASTRLAQSLAVPSFAVQHHHAHIAAVALENSHTGPLLGLALDGFGLGPNDESWGGELLAVDGSSYKRLGHLAALLQPGGDVAAREPWRMAAAALHRMGRIHEIQEKYPDQPLANMLPKVLEKGINCPETSSAGRLFDAACGLLAVCPVADFEGQAPMALEAMVRTPRVLSGGWTLSADGVLDFLPLLDALSHMSDATEGADLFHGTLIAGLTDLAVWGANVTGLKTIGLSGGCFLNKVLSAGLDASLPEHGLTPLHHTVLSPGDPCVSLGQAWVAAQSLMQESI